MNGTLVFSCCSARKDDSVPIPENAFRVLPADYLKDKSLVLRLEDTRKTIFSDSRSKLGAKTTYAFDLYTRTGKAYRRFSPNSPARLKQLMLSDKLSWFFLSAGYGIIHALEPAESYQATFNQTIAYQNGIENTTRKWQALLTKLIDAAVSNLEPEWVFFFGSKDYSIFFKKSKIWQARNKVRLFESTGSSGPNWLSPKIQELTTAILNDDVSKFSQNFDTFTKQAVK